MRRLRPTVTRCRTTSTSQELVVGLPFTGAHRGGAVIVFSTPRERITRASLDGLGASERGDWFGDAVASGDFDRDGYADLAIGAPHDRPAGRRRRVGTVTVLRGSASGLRGDGRQVFAGNRRTGPDFFVAYGRSLVAGDLNRDGFADLVVSMPGSDGSSACPDRTTDPHTGSASDQRSSSPVSIATGSPTS